MRERFLGGVNRARHREGIEQGAEGEDHRECRKIGSTREPTNRRAATLVSQLLARYPEADRDVLVGTGLHAVETEGAVEITNLGRQEESEFAAALEDEGRRLRVAAALDAIDGLAAAAHRQIASLYLHR